MKRSAFRGCLLGGAIGDALGAKAASYYAKFVELWKNADSEMQPTVAEVRQHLAR